MLSVMGLLSQNERHLALQSVEVFLKDHPLGDDYSQYSLP